MNSEPVHDAFMDSDMLRLWQKMKPLPGDFRLYGGTALALYLNHRKSTIFAFVTPLPVVEFNLIISIPWMKGAYLEGGGGMIDALIQGEHRELIITFIECGRIIPSPVRNPVTAPNGVAVADPVDLMAAKVEACISRGEQRDYEDICAAFSAWPAQIEAAISALPGRSTSAVGRALATPPTEVESELNPKVLQKLRNLARSLGLHERGLKS